MISKRCQIPILVLLLNERQRLSSLVQFGKIAVALPPAKLSRVKTISFGPETWNIPIPFPLI